jgi:autotransporter-associated beta strand protein
MSRSKRRRAPAVRKLHLTALEGRLAPAMLHWVGDIDINWGTNIAGNTNWSTNTVPQTGDTLVFGGGTLTNNNMTGLSLGGLELDGSDIVAGKPITLTGQIAALGGTPAIHFALTMAANQVVDVATGASLTMDGALGGNSSLTKTGAGALTFGGSNANTYTGATNVNNGTLILNNLGPQDTVIPGPLVVGDGAGAADSAAVQLMVNDEIYNAAAVTVNADGLFDGNNSDEYFGPLTVNGGTVTMGNADLGINGLLTMSGGSVSANGPLGVRPSGGVTSTAAATTATISGKVDLAGATRTFDVADGIQPYDLVINGVISNGGVIKTGTGNLGYKGASANLYTGATTVNAGGLIFGKLAGVNAIGGPLTVNLAGNVMYDANDQIPDSVPATINNGVFQLDSGSDSIGLLTMMGGSVNISVGHTLTLRDDLSVVASPNTATINGNLSLGGGTRTFDVADGSQSYDLIINGVISSGGVIKNGAGDLAYQGASANIYTGATTVNAGGLDLQKSAGVNAIAGPLLVGNGVNNPFVQIDANDQILDSVPLTINNAVFQLAGGSDTIGPLTITGGVVNVLPGRTLTLGGDLAVMASPIIATINGNLSLGGATRVINVDDDSQSYDLVVDGVISNGGVIKNGTGALQYRGNAANTYTGTTTVNSGRLILGKSAGVNAVAGPIVLRAHLETVADQQIADSAPVTIDDGWFQLTSSSETIGLLTMPGGGFINVLPGHTLTLSGGFTVDVSSYSPALYGGGNVNLSGSALTVDFGTPLNVGQSRKIIDNQDTVSVIGYFAGLSEYGQFTSGGKAYQISYHGGDGNDVVATRLPAAVIVSAPPLLVTSQNGHSETFTVALGSIPVDNVTIQLSSTNPDGGVPDQSTLTFTPANALTPQTVTVTSVGGKAGDSNIPFSIVTAASASNDPDYNGLDPKDVSAVNLVLLPSGRHTYTDTDGDTYTVKLTGPGTVAALLADPTGNGQGPINRIYLNGTDPTKSRLSIAVKKGKTGDGYVSIGDINGSGLKSISARNCDLIGGRVTLTGPLGGLTIHDIYNGSVIAAGTPDQKTRIKAHVMSIAGIQLGSAIGSLTAARVYYAYLAAPSLGSLVVAGDKAHGIVGDFRGTVYLSGAGVPAGKPTLRSFSVVGTVAYSLIDVASGNVGSFRAGRFLNSELSAGFIPVSSTDPMSGGTFTPGSTIGSFRVTGYNGLTTPTFENSWVGADIIGSVSLKSVSTTNNGRRFGILGHTQIGAVNAGAPSLQYKKGQSMPPPIDDFEVTII